LNLKIKKIVKIIIPLLFGGALVWYLFTIIPPETLLEYFKNANYWWIALGLLFGILSHLSRAYRWKFMLEPLGYKPRFINSTLAVLIGYFVNLAIPRAGEVSRATVMTNYEGIPFEKGFGTIVAERIADLIMMFLIIGITLLIQFDFIIELLTKNVDPVKIGVTSIFRMKNKWAFIFHTVFIWVMYILMFWATIPAINGLDVPFGGILVGFIAGGFSIAATNGGIGLYPLAVAGAFTLFGVPEEPSTAFGSVMWAAQTAMIIIFGGLSFLLLPICNKAK
jgi:uncharacterized membrane protein YbhN (UPF0104 family)